MEKKEKEPMDELNKAFEEFDIETPLNLTNEDKLDEGDYSKAWANLSGCKG